MAMPTIVKSINGDAGTPMNRNVAVDAGDIHKEGSTGDTISTIVNTIASGIVMLSLHELELDGDYRMRIGSYELITTN